MFIMFFCLFRSTCQDFIAMPLWQLGVGLSARTAVGSCASDMSSSHDSSNSIFFSDLPVFKLRGIWISNLKYCFWCELVSGITPLSHCMYIHVFFFREVSGDQHGWVVSANPKKYGWRLFYFEPHCWLPFMLFCAWTCLCIISWAFKIRIDKKTSRCLGMSQVRHVSLWNLGSAAGSSVRPWLREGQAFRESSRAREATKRCPAGFGHPPILEFPQMGVPQ